jgi:protoporphyrinogen IX oxidase
MNPLYVKAIHIIGVVTWFAGLFYLVRLFIYHAEAEERPEAEKKLLQTQYLLMERRLWTIITNPSMYITVTTGLYLAYLYGFFSAGWMHLKLGMVALLVVYHFLCRAILKQHENGVVRWSSQQLRLWNEVATLFLIAIVFVVVLKSMLSVVWGVLGLLVIGITLMILIKLYKNYRTKKPGH